MTTFTIEPRGPFDLAAASQFAAGFTPGLGGGEVGGASIVMAFPVEAPGWEDSAAVDVRQTPDGTVHCRTDAPARLQDAVRRHVARTLSLDHDGRGWPAVGERDPVIGRLQASFGPLRPVCYYSAYEAATSFVMSHRISMRQVAGIKAGLREEAGDRPTVDGAAHAAFPRPERLLELHEIRGLTGEKVRRVHGLAEAALDDRLDTERLRALPVDDALAELRALPGVGTWTAEAILLRGCGMADVVPLADEISREAVAELYGLDGLGETEWRGISDAWRPYRMWATVLLRRAMREELGARSYRQGRR